MAGQELDAVGARVVFVDGEGAGECCRPDVHLLQGTCSLGGDSHVEVQCQPSNSKSPGL